jgi:two-component system sensor histidine kinase YesM
MFNKIKNLITKELRYKMSIQLILSFFVMFMIVVAISFVTLYSGIESILKSNSENNRIQRFKQFDYNIDSFCSQIDLISRQLVINSNLQELIGYSNMAESDRAYYSSLEIKDFSEILSNYKYIESILYYGPDGLIIKSTDSGNYVLYDSGEKNDWFYHSMFYQESHENKQKLIWFGGYTDYNFGLLLKNTDTAATVTPKYYISASRNILSYGNYGTLVINVNMDFFTSIYNHSRATATESMYIIDETGKVISHQDKNMIGKMSEMFQSMSKDKDIENFTISSSKGKEQAIYYRLSSFGGILVSEVPMSEITKDIVMLRNILIVLFFLSLVFAFVLSRFWIHKLMSPLDRLIGVIRKIERGNLGLTLDDLPKNEIGELVEQFNSMSISIKDLFVRNEVAQAEKRNLEMETLRYQINPHFIYNTLNTIKWMAMINKEENIVDCISTLSDFLEPVFKKHDIMCTVQEEIRYLKNYVKIMNYRFSGGFKLDINIPEEYLDCKVIRFILQPLVENAIVHGLMDKTMGEIYIVMWSVGQDAYIKVTDNGNGMSESRLCEITELLNRPIDKIDLGIGIANVNRRLKLHFGENAGLELKNGTAGGTEVILKMLLVQ